MIDADRIHRTTLLSLHDGSAPTLDAAISAHEDRRITIVADERACELPEDQAALLTAVATAVRAFGHVEVLVGMPSAGVHLGLHRGKALADAIASEGGLVTNEVRDGAQEPCVLIGPTAEPPKQSRGVSIRASWDGWVATASPARSATIGTAGRPPCILAAIAAAGLAIHEAFDWTRTRAGSDAGYRTVSLNLWDPTNASFSDAPLTYAPHAWWLVGLGHLGQAYAWVLSHLPYPKPDDIEVVLQDTDRVTESTHSTGLLTSASNIGMRKTRLVATTLDRAGYDTRIEEHRLDASQPLQPGERHVALLGVDNLEARRCISGIGWALAIDVGLGVGPNDFASLVLRRFPGRTASGDVAAWAGRTEGVVNVPETAAFQDLRALGDACGLVELAGKAVGAAFVGVAAACLAIAEACREMHGATGFDVVTLDLQTGLATAATSDEAADVISVTF